MRRRWGPTSPAETKRIWNIADEHFGKAIQIVDYYHAAEHIGTLAKLLCPEDEVGRKKWHKSLKKHLWEGNIEKVVNILGSLNVRGKKKEEVEKTAAYFEKNKKRMRYGKFRKQKLFIGSGVVEAGCKNVIGAQLNRRPQVLPGVRLLRRLLGITTICLTESTNHVARPQAPA